MAFLLHPLLLLVKKSKLCGLTKVSTLLLVDMKNLLGNVIVIAVVFIFRNVLSIIFIIVAVVIISIIIIMNFSYEIYLSLTFVAHDLDLCSLLFLLFQTDA